MTMKSRGFTLIELLVTISIIALLSSIILVSLNGARQKGTLGSALQFADNDYHKLGANTLLSMNFNEQSGTAPLDLTGNFVFDSGNSISSATTSLLRSSNTPFSDNGSSLDVSTAGVELPMITQSGNWVTLPDQSGVTASIWINTLGGTFTNSNYAQYLFTVPIRTSPITNIGLSAIYNAGSSSVLECSLGNAIPRIQPFSLTDSNWHNVTCSYDLASGNVYLYLDGVLRSTAQVNGTYLGKTPVSINGDVYVGGNSQTSPATMFEGLIDNFQVFSGSLVE